MQLPRVTMFLKTTSISWKLSGILRRAAPLNEQTKSHTRECGVTRTTKQHHPLFGQAAGQGIRRKDVLSQDDLQGGQKLALPPWMSSRRPYFRSDCEKAFKEILRGKLKETVFWDQFLDIGCGAGDLTRSIVKVFGGHHRVVVATETSIEVVKVLRRNAAERDVLYEVMDIEKDVDEALRTWGRFRRIFSFYHLERTRNKRLALANMRELLIDNGELFLLFQTSSNLRPLFQAIKESEKWAHVTVGFEEDAFTNAAGEKPTDILRDLLHSLGFDVAQCKLMATDWVLATREKLEHMIIATSPFLLRVPQEKREEFIQDCTALAAKLLPNDGGVDFKFSYNTIMVQATRRPESPKRVDKTADDPHHQW